ncbi:MAG: GNAT family N-acetyltransferase [Chloroflexi bacterium]|nr:MAG: GNAT family N-acetyltransferase [Chloroflexota bacterium]
MIDNLPTKALVIRLATSEDIPCIEQLDSLSTSPTRDIHREMEKYFGSVDPSTHEQTFIFLAEIEGIARAKAELMLPPADTATQIGYIKRVVVHPDYRSKGLARLIIQHVINFARTTCHITAIDLHVWEGNQPAKQLYESLGFKLQHRELYYRLHID